MILEKCVFGPARGEPHTPRIVVLPVQNFWNKYTPQPSQPTLPTLIMGKKTLRTSRKSGNPTRLDNNMEIDAKATMCGAVKKVH
jgi:hypothetical protein